MGDTKQHEGAIVRLLYIGMIDEECGDFECRRAIVFEGATDDDVRRMGAFFKGGPYRLRLEPVFDGGDGGK